MQTREKKAVDKSVKFLILALVAAFGIWIFSIWNAQASHGKLAAPGESTRLMAWCIEVDDAYAAARLSANYEGDGVQEYQTFMSRRGNSCIDIRALAAVGIFTPKLPAIVVEIIDTMQRQGVVGEGYQIMKVIGPGKRYIYSWHHIMLEGA